jgi:hypothetical protein
MEFYFIIYCFYFILYSLFYYLLFLFYYLFIFFICIFYLSLLYRPSRSRYNDTLLISSSIPTICCFLFTIVASFYVLGVLFQEVFDPEDKLISYVCFMSVYFIFVYLFVSFPERFYFYLFSLFIYFFFLFQFFVGK